MDKVTYEKMYCGDCKDVVDVKLYNGECNPCIFICGDCGQFIQEAQQVKDFEPVRYSINQEKYDHALNCLGRALRPSVEFREDIDEMRKEAQELSEKYMHEAYETFTGLVVGR